MAQRELAAEQAGADGVDQFAMRMARMASFGHAALYQRRVDVASGLSLIALQRVLAENAAMTFGERLLETIKGSEFKNPNRLATALEWSPQRINNYIKKDRVPDRQSLRTLAAALKTTPEALLNEEDEASLRDILLRLFELEGIPPDRADILASAFLVAKRLLATFPDEGELQTRARLAAHSAWQTQPPQELGRQ